MATHNYVRVGKFKNVNCKYALCNGIVFPSVFAAEAYCTANGLDVNESIQSDDPAVLAECKRIATSLLPTLKYIKSQEDTAHGMVSDELTRKVKARNEAEEQAYLGWEVHNDWVNQAIGKSNGFYECTKILWDYISVLESVCRIKE